MAGRDIIVIGASAGGVGALQRLVRGLSEDLPAAVFVVLHFPAQSPSVLPAILARAGRLPAKHPVDGESFQHGTIYVAPPDHHMLVELGCVRLTRGPKENGLRPAADPLFRSAALTYGARVVGIVLSGNLGDGTAGLHAVKRRGGVAIVQDPADAEFPGMPLRAAEQVDADHVIPLDDIPEVIERHLADEVRDDLEAPMAEDELADETRIAALSDEAIAGMGSPPGRPSGYGCPDCGGVLFELGDGDVTRFRCRVGHAWSADALLTEQAETLETALWTALRALEEQAALARQVAARTTERGNARVAARFIDQARLAERRAEVIKEVLQRTPPSTPLAELAPRKPTASPAAGNGPRGNGGKRTKGARGQRG